MVVRTVKQLVMEYIKNIYVIEECPEFLYKVLTLIRLIKERGDEKAYIELKHHCDVIDENLFSSIMEALMPGIKINSDYDYKDIELITDDGLLLELRNLVTHNKAIAIGFFYDDKKRLRLNTNKCITYLQRISDLIIMNGILLVYNQNEGIWLELTEELQGTILHYLMNDSIKDSWKKTYERDIIDGLMREVPRMNKQIIYETLIAFNNGVYDIVTKKLLPHDKKYMFTSKSPIDYVEGADCPIFKKAIREILCNDDELIMCVQEIFGNALINNTKAERAFFFTGVGSNGKSFCSDILTTIVGVDNVSNIQLSKFSERFGIEGIVGKALNIANENELGGAISTESLKALISGDTINISRKFKQAINYKSTVKLIFLLNTLPDTLDNTHGYYRKILIVPFNRVFGIDDIDKTLKDKVSNELSGVLNWCLRGAERLINNKYIFTESKAVERITKAYKEEQNPVESYLKEVLVYEEGSSETKKSVLEAYKSWIEGQSISARGTDSPQKFWRALNNASKINSDKELEYKKIQGTLYLNNFKIDRSKLPNKEEKYTFSLAT